MRILFARKTIQLLAFFLPVLPIIWPSNPVWLGTYLSSRAVGIAFTDPLAAMEVLLAGKVIWWPLIWSVIPLVVVAVLLGRVFCGWICPLNTVLEFAAMLNTPRIACYANEWRPYRLLAVFFLLAAITGLPLFTIISPIGALSRAIVFGIGVELFFVPALIVMEWFYDRKAWCRSLCPVGAFYGLLGRWRLVVVCIDRTACQNCGECHRGCTMRVKVGSNAVLDQLNCTNCGDCVDVCPQKSVYFRLRNQQKGGVR